MKKMIAAAIVLLSAALFSTPGSAASHIESDGAQPDPMPLAPAISRGSAPIANPSAWSDRRLSTVSKGAQYLAIAFNDKDKDTIAPAATQLSDLALHGATAHDMAGMDRQRMDMSDMVGMDGDPKQAILALVRRRFETPDKPLTINPIVVEKDWAIAGWQQAGRGGRLLLKRGPQGWAVKLCSGDSLRKSAVLESIGLPASDAKALTDSLVAAETAVPPATLALFASFEGTVELDQQAPAGHADHTGHGK